MNTSGQQQTLQEKLQQKAEQEQEVIKKLYEENLQSLSKDLQKSSARELYIMKNATLAEIRKTSRRLNGEVHLLNGTFLSSWVRNFFIGIALMVGMFISLHYWAGWKTEELRERSQMLSQRIEEIKDQKNHLSMITHNLNKIVDQSGGIWIHEDEDGMFVIFPTETDLKTIWDKRNRPAIKIK